MIKASDYLDPHTLLKESNQHALFEYLLGPDVLKGPICSPFRVDNKPTCSLWESPRGILYLHDFGTGKMYSCIDVIIEKYRVPFKSALKILRDISKTTTPPLETARPEKNVLIEAIRKESEEDAWYWAQFGISQKTLGKFNTHSLKSVYVNGNLSMRGTRGNPLFAYSYPSGRLKIYRPLAAKNQLKWFGNAKAEDVSGLESLATKGVLVFVTSSLKDVMVLWELGFPAVCFNTEIVSAKSDVVKKTIKMLKSRYRYVVLFMDSDEAGTRSNVSLSEALRIPYIQTTGPKDVSDYFKRYKKRRTYEHLKKALCKRFRNTIDVPY